MTELLRPTTNRLHGLDIARAIAMIGMVVAHYVEDVGGTGPGVVVREFVDGRAMPLFMLLGGVGISFLVRRSADPDRDLATRALILFPMGLLLQELTTDIAIILQYYALFFVVAIALRRLPDRALIVASALLMALGAYARQVWAPSLDSYAGWEGIGTLFDPGLWWSLVVTGYYPFLPAGAFITLGMWIGRIDLRRPRIAVGLVAGGLTLALLGSWGGALVGERVGASGVVVDASGAPALADDLLARYAFDEGLTVAEASDRLEADIPGDDADALAQLADRIERSTPGFRWQRLFDAEGHSQMPAWVVGTMGTSMLVIGVSLVAARRFRLFSLSVLGEMALTFYAYQAIVINWTPERSATTTLQEYLIAAGITLVFLVLALGWKWTVGRGPLEQLLRVGSAPRASGGPSR